MPESDLALLTGTVRSAAEIALSHWRRKPAAWDKGGGQGPVSEADLAVDDFLRERLMAARPDYGWLSEESEDHPARLSRRRVFIVDPIDGTRAYLDGDTSWAISVAVAEEGEATTGVVFLPALERFYGAATGAGAWRDGARVWASERQDIKGAQVLAAASSFDPRHWPAGQPPVKRHFRPSLAYRMCLVAEGRFDAMITFRDSWEWDIAAGELIAREAGAVVTDASGQPLRLNSPRARTGGVIAAGAGLHPALMRR